MSQRIEGPPRPEIREADRSRASGPAVVERGQDARTARPSKNSAADDVQTNARKREADEKEQTNIRRGKNNRNQDAKAPVGEKRDAEATVLSHQEKKSPRKELRMSHSGAQFATGRRNGAKNASFEIRKASRARAPDSPTPGEGRSPNSPAIGEPPI